MTDPQADLESQERSDTLRRAIDALPERRRAVVELRWMRQLSHREIAEVLDIGVKGVEIHITRALKSLRRALGEEAP